MKVKVRLFASAREAVGEGEIAMEVADGATAAEVAAALAQGRPRLQKWLGHLKYAVNLEHAPPGATLSDGDELALLPPFEGG